MSVQKFTDQDQDQDIRRLKVLIEGVVQGVGFRPFVYCLAKDIGLPGWVCNSAQGVLIELEGSPEKLDEFLIRIQDNKPRLSIIQSIDYSFHHTVGYSSFQVKHSQDGGEKSALILPDIATCPLCFEEIFDPDNRRFRYPFTNCTNCGPRYSIIEALPYDRVNTTMRQFPMCDSCREEYTNPSDRRFHAQPNACPDCGPHLELWDKTGSVLAKHHDALLVACESVKNGRIIALKGLGGFHLIVDATNDEAVKRLRRLKARPDKPFAVMYPSIDDVRNVCETSILEEQLLGSIESPIVILKQKSEISGRSSGISNQIAPGNPYLGILLPYTPLHHLFMAELKSPIVATSGNLSDEPICFDEHEALDRLGNIADLFLVHNRPIARHVDDSIVRTIMGQKTILRRARGYAPLPVHFGNPLPAILAVGGHQKNSIAISGGKQVFISQYIGDLENKQSYDTFTRVIRSLSDLYDLKPEKIACDKHPDYLSTQYAEDSKLPRVEVQHHYAHVLSCMAENEIEGPVLGIAWDGTGHGDDGTIWGGEFIRVEKNSYSRVAHLRTFRLPGGEQAVREPWRSALGLLYELYGDSLFKARKFEYLFPSNIFIKDTLRKMLKRNINTPLTTSAGRLFDAVAAIVGLGNIISYEGQAAMKLEFAAEEVETCQTYKYDIKSVNNSYILDWEHMIRDIVKDREKSVPRKLISTRFHNTLAEMIVGIAKFIDEKKVVLTGGCFQNKYLAERAIVCLKESGFQPYWHHLVPPNDGGICLGQIIACVNEFRGDKKHVPGNSR